MPTRAIKAIFYTRFHHEKGNRVLHQVPPGSITPSSLPSALPTPLVPFPSVTQYLIPNQQFCDRLLTFCINHHRVIGYPVCIREGKYSRNEFIFNFAIVIGENERDWACYGEVVRKLGKLLRGLEEQGGFLSREEEAVWEDDGNGHLGVGMDDGVCGFGVGGGSKVYALCEMVLEDLNNYAECMIPIDDSNTINLKLFPTRPPPPPILAHQVPLLTISLSGLQQPVSSDLTLNRILPFINGVNSIAHISQLADTDLSLTRRAIQHLVYYGCLVLLDIFSFGAIYAPTAEIGGFVVDADVKEECMRYVSVPRMRVGSTSTTTKPTQDDEQSSTTNTPSSSHHSSAISTPMLPPQDAPETWHHPSPETLITLYTSLRQGLTLKNWVLENLDLLTGIDIRRFITFGIIKGFLYRVHKYAIATTASTAGRGHKMNNHNSINKMPPAPPTSAATSVTEKLHSKVLLYPEFGVQRNHGDGDGMAGEKSGLPLLRFLDGVHCFDEICTELGVQERVVEGKVRGGWRGHWGGIRGGCSSVKRGGVSLLVFDVWLDFSKIGIGCCFSCLWGVEGKADVDSAL